MATRKHLASFGKHKKTHTAMFEALETRWLLAAVTLDPGTTYQTIQGWGAAPLYPSGLTIAQVGNVMKDAGMNTVRITAGPGEFTYTTGGNLTTPVALSSNIDSNVPLFGGSGMTQETDLVKWLETNGLNPTRTKMIGSLWSPPQWMKISTGTLMTWTNNGVQQSGYDPVMPYGAYGGNTAGGRINPAMYTQWAEFVLSDVKAWEQMAGIPMYAFSFQNEPDVQAAYNSMFLNRIAVNANDPTQGTTTGQWQLYGDALSALATQLASNPDITTKFFGPELEALGPSASNPWFLSNYFTIRQDLINEGLLGDLGAYTTHDYQYAKDQDAAVWDAFYNGSAHAAEILTNGTSNVLGWLYPQTGVASDNKEIWQTETEGEDQTWTKDGAMGFGLKIFDALVYGHVSGYTTWQLISSNPGDAWGLVDVANINNPTASYKFDAFKQFSRWIAPGSQRISAVFDNGKASAGGANELDTYNGLNVAAFNDAQDKRLTTVFVNMQTTDQTTTITIPASVSCNSYQVYETTGTQHYVQLADLVPSNGKITITVPASSFVTITGSYAATTLPAPWVSNDIGSPSPAGSAAHNATTGTYTVSGGGSDIWNNSDQFQYLSQSFSGNGQVAACVTSVSNTNYAAKAGVMFRDSTAANASYAFAWVSPGNNVEFETRASDGTSSNYSVTVAAGGSPVWVKLVRSGANSIQFSAYYSRNGVTWTPLGTTQTVTMADSALVGLAVTSHANGTLCTSTFTGVQVLQKGDLNGDGKINTADISALMNALSDLALYISGRGIQAADLPIIADIDGDGKTTSRDIQALISLLANSTAGQEGGGSADGSVALEPNVVSTSSVAPATAPLAATAPVAISTSSMSASMPAASPPVKHNALFPVSLGSDANWLSARMDLAHPAFNLRTPADSSSSPRDRLAEARLQWILPFGRAYLRRAAHRSNPLSLETLDQFFAGGIPG